MMMREVLKKTTFDVSKSINNKKFNELLSSNSTNFKLYPIERLYITYQLVILCNKIEHILSFLGNNAR